MPIHVQTKTTLCDAVALHSCSEISEPAFEPTGGFRGLFDDDGIPWEKAPAELLKDHHRQLLHELRLTEKQQAAFAQVQWKLEGWKRFDSKYWKIWEGPGYDYVSQYEMEVAGLPVDDPEVELAAERARAWNKRKSSLDKLKWYQPLVKLGKGLVSGIASAVTAPVRLWKSLTKSMSIVEKPLKSALKEPDLSIPGAWPGSVHSSEYIKSKKPVKIRKVSFSTAPEEDCIRLVPKWMDKTDAEWDEASAKFQKVEVKSVGRVKEGDCAPLVGVTVVPAYSSGDVEMVDAWTLN